MSQIYFGLVTAVGLAKLAASAAGGPSLTLSAMAFGDGGGAETAPTSAATGLVNERYRALLVDKYPHPTNPAILYVEGVIPSGIGGWTLREAGIYDADGDLIVIAKTPALNVALVAEGATTEGVVRLPIVFDGASSVQILIDPTVVLATQAWAVERLLLRPWLTVDSATTTAPPAVPTAHMLYLVPTGATGAWAGQAGKLAYYLGSWRYYASPVGKHISASDTGKAYRRTATGWEELWVETEVANAISKSGIATAPGSGLRLPQAMRSAQMNYAVCAGTGNAIAATLDPPVTALNQVRWLILVPIASNVAGLVNMTINGLGPYPVKSRGATLLPAGTLIAGVPAMVMIDGTAIHLVDAAVASDEAVYDASGNWTCPNNVARIWQIVTGGGGGATGNSVSQGGSTGGGAGTAMGFKDVAPGTVYPATVGAPGAGGAINLGSDGGDGGDSTFNGMTGGRGRGAKASGPVNGAGGTASGGKLNIAGSDGMDGVPGSSEWAGNGGSSWWGGGASSGVTTVGPPDIPGVGGASVYGSIASVGGAGKGGRIYVRYGF